MKMSGSRSILCICAALALAGCSAIQEDIQRTPLQVSASLSASAPLTKASAGAFAEGDVLHVYFRHTTGGTLGNYSVTPADQAPRLVDFTVGSTGEISTSPILYWDDFSNSASDATDLRTSGHGLQSYYGYCYNGGTPSTALTLTSGELGWTIGNQTTAEAVQHADLLWSAEQASVTYAHTASQGGEHGTLNIPFSHAMSEITVTVIAGTGFSSTANPLASTTLTLNGMNSVTTFTAPTATFTSSTPVTVAMFGHAISEGDLSRTYTAIVAPGTELKVDELLLSIVNVEDNNYSLKVTDAMLGGSAWASGHTPGSEGGKTFILTQPGYHYHLDVHVAKTEIDAHASLTDWTTVTASGTGEVIFDDDDILVMDDADYSGYSTDVQVVAVDKNKFVPNASFSLFMVKHDTSHDTPAERTNSAYDFATVSTFVDNAGEANDEWTNSPAIYWPNKTDRFYFRALAQFNGESAGVTDIASVGTYNTDKGTAVSQGTVAAGHDIIWGTSAQHKGSTTEHVYARGDAIPPRTGGVPIAFKHAMSKVTFILETAGADGDPLSATSPKVDLREAEIAVSNLYTSGTIAIEDGAITPAASKTVAAIAGSNTAATLVKNLTVVDQLIVVPQTIGDDSIVTITLKDPSTHDTVAVYKLQLNQCINGVTPIGTWARGNSYIYTVHVEKEQVSLRALVLDWVNVDGSGDANLEWD